LPNLKSAKKRMRSSKRKQKRNQLVRGKFRGAIRKANRLIDSENAEEAYEAIQAAYRELDRAAVKGVIHKNKAARHKSRLMEKYNELTAE